MVLNIWLPLRPEREGKVSGNLVPTALSETPAISSPMREDDGDSCSAPSPKARVAARRVRTT